MVKQLIYDSCMIVKKETIISIYHDIQVVHKKHDGMIVVFLKSIIVLTNLNHKCRFIRYFSLERIVTDKVQIRSESTDRFPAIQFCFQHNLCPSSTKAIKCRKYFCIIVLTNPLLQFFFLPAPSLTCLDFS